MYACTHVMYIRMYVQKDEDDHMSVDHTVYAYIHIYIHTERDHFFGDVIPNMFCMHLRVRVCIMCALYECVCVHMYVILRIFVCMLCTMCMCVFIYAYLQASSAESSGHVR
jgi:hypothetical protein